MTDEKSFTHNDYEVVDRTVVYQGVFRLAHYHIRQRLYNGGWSETYHREVFERYMGAAILPYDPLRDHVILIEQFRPGSLADPKSPWLIEIPAGVITHNEKPDSVATREAMEEAGCEITTIEPICEYFVSPGASNEYLNLYIGKVDSADVGGIHGLVHEHEDIRVINIPAEEAFARLRSGHIKTSPAIIALLWLQLHRRRLQDLW